MTGGLRKIFKDIAGKYELNNHILTFGLDKVWRKKAIIAALANKGTKYLDVCTGTGEITGMLNRLSRKDIKIYGTDFSKTMLTLARSRHNSKNISFIQAEAINLPFADNSFDCIIASFAARNLSISEGLFTNSLTEFYRVLKPGGRLINLETSQPANRIVRLLFHMYIRYVIKPFGKIISGSKSAYIYLSHSIIIFFNPKELTLILEDSGFKNISTIRLLMGVAAIHIAEK